MRGGGPSTYAVMLSMTVKAYPKFEVVEYMFQYNTAADSDLFWNLVGAFLLQLLYLFELGVMGYYYLVPISGPAESNPAGFIQGTFLFPNKSRAEAEILTQLLELSLKESCSVTGPLGIRSSFTNFSKFMQFWSSTNGAEGVGRDTRYGSWLLDGRALTYNNKT
jgi:hypothetical protein